MKKKTHLAGPVVGKVQKCSACGFVLCDFSHPDWKEGDYFFFKEGEPVVETYAALAYPCHLLDTPVDAIESCRPCPGKENCPHEEVPE